MTDILKLPDPPRNTRKTCLVEDEAGVPLGTDDLRPSQPALGAHVCNRGSIVAEAARGRGVATALCEYSRQEARGQGDRAMPYNLVIGLPRTTE